MNWVENKLLALFVKSKGYFSKPFFSGMGHIFMLHRVLPESERNTYTFNRNLAITPACLEENIVFFKKNGYRFISLDELYNNLFHGKKTAEKFVCFTLDDGYRDNLLYAYPLFKKYGVPFTVYVTNCFPNHTAILWWYWLEEWILKNDSLSFEGENYRCDADSAKQQLYTSLSPRFKNANQETRLAWTKKYFNKTEEEIIYELQKTSLSWDEIRQIHQDTFGNIGAHTINHLSLAHLQEADMQEEILLSKNELEQKIGTPILHFAYPYGSLDDVNSRAFHAVHKAGFKTATLNRVGNIFSSHKNASMALPRYPLGDSISAQKRSEYLNGITHFSLNQFSKSLAY